MGRASVPPHAGGESRRRALERASPLAVLLFAVLPALGTLAAPWIAEDSTILRRVQEDGWLADWTRSQYGLELVRFWRPVVSTSWSLQAAWTGIDVVPLRLLNTGLHAGTALLAFALARRAGTTLAGGLLAGALVAFFPDQGGTVTWLAGRTDLWAGFLMLAACRVALGRTPLLAAPLAFLACASKEFAFLLPGWVLALAWAAREPPRRVVERVVPVAAAVLVAFAWRRLALGTFTGGYPAPDQGWLGAAETFLGAARALWIELALLAALLVLASFAGSADGRGAAAGLACAALGCLPLFPLLADGAIEDQNRRLFHVAALGLALAGGAAFARPARHALAGRAALALAVIWTAVSGVRAWQDTREWRDAARLGEQAVAAARGAVTSAGAGSAPVLVAGFPTATSGAYCLSWGVADRFRPPFPASPRPVWPLRALFDPDPKVQELALALREIPHPSGPLTGALWPLDDPARVPRIAVTLEGRDDFGALLVDERAFQAEVDGSDVLRFHGRFPGDRLELAVYTELGYATAPFGALAEDLQEHALTLMQTMGASSGAATIAQTLMQAADLGATRAFLELRIVGPRGELLAASRWIELVWRPELLARALGRS